MFWWITGVGSIISAIAIYRTLKGRAILYYNGLDFGISVFFIVAWVINKGADTNGWYEGALLVGAIIEVLAVLYHCFMAIWCNRNILDSFLMIITRIFFTAVLALTYFIAAALIAGGKKGEKQSDAEYMIQRAAGIFAGVSIITGLSRFVVSICDGKRVMEDKKFEGRN